MGKPAELGGISPPEFFLISTPPSRGTILSKIFPPFKIVLSQLSKDIQVLRPSGGSSERASFEQDFTWSQHFFGQFQENPGILDKICKENLPPKISPPPFGSSQISPPGESGACPHMPTLVWTNGQAGPKYFGPNSLFIVYRTIRSS